ncbi:MAG: hypothetical protein GY906_38970 [bacterium]|nr:hypothetical protein [bacterium]
MSDELSPLAKAAMDDPVKTAKGLSDFCFLWFETSQKMKAERDEARRERDNAIAARDAAITGCGHADAECKTWKAAWDRLWDDVAHSKPGTPKDQMLSALGHYDPRKAAEEPEPEADSGTAKEEKPEI